MGIALKKTFFLGAFASLFVASVASAATVDLTCMKNVTKLREDAFVTAWENFTTLTKAIKQVRRDGLVNAWTIQDAKQRKQAIKNTEKSYKDSFRVYQKNFKTAEKSANDNFRSQAKVCKQ